MIPINAISIRWQVVWSKVVTQKINKSMKQADICREFFDTEYLKADLKGRSVRGGAVTIASQIITKIIQVGSIMVLARVLVPQDFGMIAMTTAIVGFVMLFKDIGLSVATVQWENINHAQISTLFWINVLLSMLNMMFIIALAPVIAWFYREPRLLRITIALSVGFIFAGFTTQHIALLRRQMRFGAIAAVNIAGILAGAMVGIGAALAGTGVWALVYMTLARSLTIALVPWFVCPWRPGLPKRSARIRGMLAFGGNLTGSNIINYFARNTDNMLIGKFWGSTQLGLYNRAYELLMLPLRQVAYPIASVAIPTLSRLQHDPQQYRRYYYRAMNTLAFITTPIVLIMAGLCDEIIVIVLGNQWAKAAMIFKVLAFAAVFEPLTSTVEWVWVSLGQTKRMLQWEFISVPIIVLSFVVGLPWGSLGVAISYAICSVLILMVPRLRFAFRYSPLSIVGFLRAIRYPITISLISYVVIELTSLYLDSFGTATVLLGSCTSGLVTFFLFVFIWPNARAEFVDLISTIKMLRN